MEVEVENVVLIDSEPKNSSVTSTKDEWLNHTETVTVDENPPLLDESAFKVIRKLEDGSHEELYKCDYCQKHLFSPAQLSAHRWTHTKPFKCEVCLERFPAKGNLVSKLLTLPIIKVIDLIRNNF